MEQTMYDATRRIGQHQAEAFEEMRVRLQLARPDVDWEALLSDAERKARGSLDVSFLELVKATVNLALCEPAKP